MSSEDQAEAYFEEAQLTLSSARAIFSVAEESGENLWAQVVKNGYDAIEQAISAAIAITGESIPRAHPAKVNTFIDVCEPPEELEETLLDWLRRRSDSQYVDIRGEEVNVPHEQFTRQDAERILEDVETVLEWTDEEFDIS